MKKLYIVALLIINTVFSASAVTSTKQEVLNLKLTMAVCKNKINLKKIRSLLMAGANTEYRPWGGNTLLHIVVGRNKIDSMRALIGFHADVNSRNRDDGETSLIVAARSGYFDAMKILVDSGADINTVDEEGNTLLHLVANKGLENIMKFLLALPNPDFNQCDEMATVQNKHLSHIKQMISRRNRDTYTVADLAYKYAMKVRSTIGKKGISSFMYLYTIEKIDEYASLDQKLKNKIEENYKK